MRPYQRFEIQCEVLRCRTARAAAAPALHGRTLSWRSLHVRAVVSPPPRTGAAIAPLAASHRPSRPPLPGLVEELSRHARMRPCHCLRAGKSHHHSGLEVYLRRGVEGSIAGSGSHRWRSAVCCVHVQGLDDAQSWGELSFSFFWFYGA